MADQSAHVPSRGGRVSAAAVAGSDGSSIYVGDQRGRNHACRDSPTSLLLELGILRGRGRHAEGHGPRIHADADVVAVGALQERLYGAYGNEGVQWRASPTALSADGYEHADERREAGVGGPANRGFLPGADARPIVGAVHQSSAV